MTLTSARTRRANRDVLRDVGCDVLVGAGLTLPLALLVTVGNDRAPAAVTGLVALVTAAGLVLAVRARRAVRAVRHARSHDGLTGLPTRPLFLAELAGLLRTVQGDDEPVAVAVVDVDHHRALVHSWGRAAGDAVMLLVAHCLVELLPAGTPVARLGGNAFAAVLRGDGPELERQAERLRRGLDRSLDLGALPDAEPLGRLEPAVTVSVGFAQETIPADADRLLQDADLAMHEAHRLGGNRVARFDGTLGTAARRRAAVEVGLRHAVERDELFLVYQPVVDLPQGRVIGAEALLRWTNPQLGDVSPVEFVPVAEDCGIIESLGAWVIEEASRRLVLWDATGLLPAGFTMAINVSTRQLRSDRLAVQLRDVLETARVAPDRIVLEITESAMHDDTEAFVEVLTGLRRLGVHLSVDDFGTGYSSLSYLRRLPVTSVKLDRSLVENVAQPPGDAIARAVQQIAGALGLVVIAEGVENEAQRDALRELGIEQAQGWLWGRPMLPKDFLAPLVAAAALRGDAPARPRAVARQPVRQSVRPTRSTTTGA